MFSEEMSRTEINDDLIKTFWDKSSSYSTAKRWAAEFRRGRESVDVYERSWRPKMVTTDENVELVQSDHV